MIVQVQLEPKEILQEKHQAPVSGELAEGRAEVQSHTGWGGWVEFLPDPRVHKKVLSFCDLWLCSSRWLLLGILWTHF